MTTCIIIILYSIIIIVIVIVIIIIYLNFISSPLAFLIFCPFIKNYNYCIDKFYYFTNLVQR